MKVSAPTFLHGYVDLPINKIARLPVLCREDYETDIPELMEDIKQHGQHTPILARPTELGNYEVVAGERRFIACQKLEAKTVKAIIKPMNDEEACLLRLSENLQRKDLTDYEKGKWFKFLMDKFGWNQEQLAQKINKRQNYVSRHIQHSEVVEANFIPRGINPSEITEKQTRPLVSLPEEKRKEVVEEIAIQKDINNHVPSSAKINEIKQRFATPPKEMHVREQTVYSVGEYDCPHCKRHYVIKCDGRKDWLD